MRPPVADKCGYNGYTCAGIKSLPVLGNQAITCLSSGTGYLNFYNLPQKFAGIQANVDVKDFSGQSAPDAMCDSSLIDYALKFKDIIGIPDTLICYGDDGLFSDGILKPLQSLLIQQNFLTEIDPYYPTQLLASIGFAPGFAAASAMIQSPCTNLAVDVKWLDDDESGSCCFQKLTRNIKYNISSDSATTQDGLPKYMWIMSGGSLQMTTTEALDIELTESSLTGRVYKEPNSVNEEDKSYISIHTYYGNVKSLQKWINDYDIKSVEDADKTDATTKKWRYVRHVWSKDIQLPKDPKVEAYILIATALRTCTSKIESLTLTDCAKSTQIKPAILLTCALSVHQFTCGLDPYYKSLKLPAIAFAPGFVAASAVNQSPCNSLLVKLTWCLDGGCPILADSLKNVSYNWDSDSATVTVSKKPKYQWTVSAGSIKLTKDMSVNVTASTSAEAQRLGDPLKADRSYIFAKIEYDTSAKKWTYKQMCWCTALKTSLSTTLYILIATALRTCTNRFDLLTTAQCLAVSMLTVLLTCVLSLNQFTCGTLPAISLFDMATTMHSDWNIFAYSKDETTAKWVHVLKASAALNIPVYLTSSKTVTWRQLESKSSGKYVMLYDASSKMIRLASLQLC